MGQKIPLRAQYDKRKPQAFQFPIEEFLTLLTKEHRHIHYQDEQIEAKKWKNESLKNFIIEKQKMSKPFHMVVKIAFVSLE